MFQKILACTCALLVALSFCGCDENSTNREETPEPIVATEPIAKTVETAEDLSGIWRIEYPWPEREAEEFGEDLGIDHFVTTANFVFFVELKSDGTAVFLRDYDLVAEAAKLSYYTIFHEAFTQAKQVLDEETFEQKVTGTYGYECYIEFLEGTVPDWRQDSASHVQFYQEAQAEMLKYADRPIEEQAAIGALWGEILEEVGSSCEYVSGEWVSIAPHEFTWSFDGSTLYLGETACQISGTTQQFSATHGSSSTVWYKYEK